MWALFSRNLMTPPQLSVAFFLQMFVVLCICKVVGRMARYIGQPQVVGEMIAGVLLGPSLIGHFFPQAQAVIFPKESLKVLYVGAQLGVGLYMFLVGLDFKTEQFKGKAKSAVFVSGAGMAAPFLLGVALAIPFFKMPGLFSEKARLFEAMLFMGAAMSITAFPMLARIIHERGITGTALGTLALAAGAIDDVAAWGVLAIVLATFGGGPMVAVMAIGGGILYAAVVLLLGPKLLAPLGREAERQQAVTPSMLATVLACFMVSAWVTDAIGIHAVFGGFLLGIAMPRGVLARELRAQLEPFTVVFLLPMFFCYSGLNTRLDMVNSLPLLLTAVAVLVAAVLGKGGACWAAARMAGEDNRTALGVGALMNSRGLMELIILNIGLQKGVIGAPLFAIMVLMAIVTTLLTSPMFEWVYGTKRKAVGEVAPVPLEG